MARNHNQELQDRRREIHNQINKIYALLEVVLNKPSFLEELKKRHPDVDWDLRDTDDQYGYTALMIAKKELEAIVTHEAVVYYP